MVEDEIINQFISSFSFRQFECEQCFCNDIVVQHIPISRQLACDARDLWEIEYHFTVHLIAGAQLT